MSKVGLAQLVDCWPSEQGGHGFDSLGLTNKLKVLTRPARGLDDQVEMAVPYRSVRGKNSVLVMIN